VSLAAPVEFCAFARAGSLVPNAMLTRFNAPLKIGRRDFSQ
jgi:hypothetical protein